jgi:hypothetical protein
MEGRDGEKCLERGKKNINAILFYASANLLQFPSLGRDGK